MLDKPGRGKPANGPNLDYPAYVAYAGAPQQSWPSRRPFERKIRQVGAPLGVLILLGIIAGLIVIGLTALNPVGASVGFVLSGVAIAVVVLAYIWLDRWEPEPPRLLIFAFLWGASVAVILSVIIGLFVDSLIVQSGSEDVSWVSIAIGAPVIEEAAKGAFLLLMMTGRRRNELNSLTDCLVYAGLVGAGFAWLEDILYIAGGETLGDSLLTAGVRLIMGPFAHSLFTTMFALGVWFALQNRNPAVKVVLHPARVSRGGDHARAVERVVGDRAGDVPRGVCLLDGAGLRVRDRARGAKPQEGATDRRRETAGHGGRPPRHAERGDVAEFDQEPQAGDRCGQPHRWKAGR